MNHKVGIWIDHKKAVIVFASGDRVTTRTLESDVGPHARYSDHAGYPTPDGPRNGGGEKTYEERHDQLLDRYYDGLFIRPASGTGQTTLNLFAQHMKHPVINACSDFTHPCQGLADLLTIWEKKGRLDNLKIAWSGDPWNVCHSLMVGCSLMGMDMYMAFPEGYNPHPDVLKFATEHADANRSKIVVTRSLEEALEGADVVVANVFFSMAHDAEKEKRKKDFAPYQINAKVVKAAKSDYVFMHCGPGYPGIEATEEIFEGPHSAYYDEAENRLHTEKALLALFCS